MTEPVDLRVTDARVVTPAETFDGGVAVDDGVIVEVGPDHRLPPAAVDVDAEGNLLVPGFIDPHVHLGIFANAPDVEDTYHDRLAADFETETRGALHGGTTSVVNFLLQDEPYLPDMETFTRAGERNSYIDFGFHAIMNRDHHVEEMEGLADAGVRSFKLFYNMYKNAAPEQGIGHADADRVYEVLSRSADIPGSLVMFHAENDDLNTVRRRELRAEGRDGLEAWAASSPPIGEAMQVEQIAMLTDHTDARAYIVHTSAAEAMDVIARYRDRGVDIHGETITPFLGRTYEDEEIGPWGKINTPIRGPENQKRLWDGLRRGTLDYVGTDTNPYELWHKGPTDRSVWEAPPGDQNGIEYNLAVMMSEGVNGNRLPVERVVEVCSTNPAKLFGLYPRKGTIEVGTDADMVVVDLEATTTIDDDFYHTMEPRWSSYHGKTVTGLPTHTIVDGELAVERGELLVEKGGGRYLGRDVDGPPRRT